MGLVADSCDQLVRRSPLRPCHGDVLRPDPKHRMVAERHRLGRGQRAKKSLISLSVVLRIVLPLVSPANFKSIVRNAQGNFLALPVFPALLAPSGRVDWSGLGHAPLNTFQWPAVRPRCSSYPSLKLMTLLTPQGGNLIE